jgi:2,5-diamino-6-(ribosylamino)-4(3H)-pyrimidinone 5'-phosphate reductase
MRPKIIMHNQISLDGSLTNFTVNMELHYQILGSLNADAHLIGSNTAKTGLTQFIDEIPAETPQDYQRPSPQDDESRPYWILIDSHANMYNLLHIFRQFEYCKDLIVLITSNTPQKYLKYLQKRQYPTIITGDKHINILQSLELLNKNYNINTIVTDTGQELNSLLLNQGLIDEISIIIAPTIVGTTQLNVSKNLPFIKSLYKLELLSTRIYDQFIHIHYNVKDKTGESTSI